MRTLTLLAIMATAMAETPKPKAEAPAAKPLNTPEVIALQVTYKEMKELTDRHQALVKQRDQIVADACLRIHQTASCKLDEQTGQLVKIDAAPAKKDEKK